MQHLHHVAWRGFALCALLLSTTAFAADASGQEVCVSPTDPLLHYSGRWDTQDAQGPRCEWPAGQVRFAFEGTSASITLDGKPGSTLQIVVDGAPIGVITLRGAATYPLAANLSPGKHVVEVSKRNERNNGEPGPVQVRGIRLAPGATLLAPPAYAHKVEFLGDSITCGYGNEAPSDSAPFSLALHNTWLSWGAIAARELNAEFYCEAKSGICLMDVPGKASLPAIWDRTMPVTPSQPWDFTRWQPEAVVINLGTNDAHAQKPLQEQAWHDAYVAFIKRIRSVYPDAHIFLCIGGMGHKGIPPYNAAIVSEFASTGDTRIHSVALVNRSKEDGIGLYGHPSVATHRKMGKQIADVMRTELHW
jgi:lysophospholipase L1-like esterase